MSAEQYLQQYSKGDLELDINQLDNFNKIKYEKTKQLLDKLIKFRESIENLIKGDLNDKNK